MPCLSMHGGLGFDHTCLHPWLDPLGDVLHLVYYDSSAHPRKRTSCKSVSATRSWWYSKRAAMSLTSRNRRPFSKRSEDGYGAPEELYSPECVEEGFSEVRGLL